MRCRILLLALCVFVFSAYVSLPFGPTHVIPSYNNAKANWQMAGLQSLGGIASIDAGRTNCTSGQAGLTMPLAPSGLTPPVANDDAANINKAITNCPANTIVQLTSGTFNLDVSENIFLNKSLTLRGGTCTGSTPHSYCQTQIVYRNGLLPYGGTTPGTCGTSPSSTNSCNNFALIFVDNQGLYSHRWAGCGYPNNVLAGNCSSSYYASLAVDASPGATTIQVSTTSIFSVGMWVYINEATSAGWQSDPVNRAVDGGGSPNQIWASPDTFNTTGNNPSGRTAYLYFNPIVDNGASSAAAAETESAVYSFFYDRPYGEIHHISAIGAGPCPGANCTITFDSPLMVQMRQSGSYNGIVSVPTDSTPVYAPLLEKAGVENISLGRSANGNLNFNFCAYCWALNVDSWGWEGGAVELISSPRTEINTVYGYDCYSSVNSGGEYVFDFMAGTTEAYLVNSISRTGGKNMTNRGGGPGSVVAYNYMDDQWYDSYSGIGSYFMDLSLNASHFPGSHHVLFEGNQAVNMDADATHGSGADYMVFYRNWATGLRTPFTDPEGFSVNDFIANGGRSCPSGPGSCVASGPGAARAAGPYSYNYWYAFVGNVMGTTTNNVIGGTPYTTAGNGWTFDSCIQVACGGGAIWTRGSAQGNGFDPNLYHGNSTPYMFRDGNYDFYNGSVSWASGSHSLPNSLYLSAAPSFFSAGASCSYPFPWVTPTSGSPLQTASGSGACTTYAGLPARARYQAGTPFVQP